MVIISYSFNNNATISIFSQFSAPTIKIMEFHEIIKYFQVPTHRIGIISQDYNSSSQEIYLIIVMEVENLKKSDETLRNMLVHASY